MGRISIGVVLAACGCMGGLTAAATGSSGTDGSDTADAASGDDAGPGTGASSMTSAGSADGSSGAPPGSGDASSGDAGSTGDPATSTADADATTTTTADDASSTGDAFDCESGESFADLHTVPDAIEVDAAMNVDPAWGGLSGAPDVAWSSVAGAGTITFQVEVPCDRTYYLWGLTWDQIHGVNNCSGITNADAYMVSVDGGAEIQWSYGCQGCANPDEVWTWTIVHAYQASGCVTNLWPVPLTAGTHTVRFRNLDAGVFDPPTGPNVAAIAAMAISDDMTLTPMWP